MDTSFLTSATTFTCSSVSSSGRSSNSPRTSSAASALSACSASPASTASAPRSRTASAAARDSALGTTTSVGAVACSSTGAACSGVDIVFYPIRGPGELEGPVQPGRLTTAISSSVNRFHLSARLFFVSCEATSTRPSEATSTTI